MSPPTSTLNANLRAEMARKNVTQIQLAGRTGMSQPAFSRRLNGEAEWSVTEVYRLAEVLGVPLSALLPEVAA